MNFKKVTSLICTAAVLTTLFAGCGNTKSNSNTSTKKSNIKIGLSTDEGGLNDKSFNQAADTGIKRAQKELGLQYQAVESKTKDDYQTNLSALINAKCNLVFGVGYQMQDAITNLAKQYPDQNFAVIDTTVDSPKVESITFKEQEGSFLVGVIAGKMTKTNKIGFIGGKNQPLIEKFEAGFAAGVKAVNPTAAAGLLAKDENSLGSEVKYADSFTDTGKGSELATELYNDGCDVVYHSAGGVGIGLFTVAKKLKDSGKNVWAIGVDMDQAVSVPEYASVILTSMIKKVDNATYDAVKDLANNSFKAGKHVELGLKEDGVGYAPSTKNNVPADVITLVNKYQDKIKSGAIVVPTQRSAVASFTAPEVK